MEKPSGNHWYIGAPIWISDCAESWVPGVIVPPCEKSDTETLYCQQITLTRNGQGRAWSPSVESKDSYADDEEPILRVPKKNAVLDESMVPMNGRSSPKKKVSNQFRGSSNSGSAADPAVFLLPRDHGDCTPIKVDNMDDLSNLHEAAVLDTLRTRFEQDIIYTSTGPILIALNPYQELGTFGEKHFERYHSMDTRSNSTLALPPHSFKTAQEAFLELKHRKRDQSLVICGESGAGKTETTKRMLKFLTTSSGTISRPTQHATNDNSLGNRIMQSNPITEAFGNAKTICNDNSSRFGKFIRLQYGDKFSIVGATVTNYLLEKCRVVTQPKGERNYHIFYQFLAGADDVTRKRFLLPSRKASLDLPFRYLNQTRESAVVDHVDDQHEYNVTCQAMQDIGMSQESIEFALSVLGAVLHLGNIAFEAESDTSDNATIARDAATQHALQAFCETAGFHGDLKPNVELALTTRQITAAREGKMIETPLSVANAETTRDALAKALYDSLFNWLITQINRATRAAKGQASYFVGILDIYGFENLETNAFEQLFINFANEKLQSTFNEHVFRMEAAQYRKEGISIDSAQSFPDNRTCLELIERSPTGILSLIDEESMLGQGSDENLARKINRQHATHDCIVKCGPRGGNLSFGIKHYAGTIVYQTSEFVTKNRDTLNTLVLTLMKSSTITNISDLFVKETTTAKPNNTKQSRGLQQTVGSMFKVQLAELIDTIERTTPRFVRCIKSNDFKAPRTFDAPNVLRQLTYAGVLEALKVRRSGYPNRLSFQDFCIRFTIVNGKAATALLLRQSKDKSGDSCAAMWKQECKTLIKERFPKLGVQLEGDQILIGKTKVFLRAHILQELDAAQGRFLGIHVTTIQTRYRGFKCKRHFESLKVAVLMCQKLVRGGRARKVHSELVKALQHSRRRTNLSLKVSQSVKHGHKVLELARNQLDEFNSKVKELSSLRDHESNIICCLDVESPTLNVVQPLQQTQDSFATQSVLHKVSLPETIQQSFATSDPSSLLPSAAQQLGKVQGNLAITPTLDKVQQQCHVNLATAPTSSSILSAVQKLKEADNHFRTAQDKLLKLESVLHEHQRLHGDTSKLLDSDGYISDDTLNLVESKCFKVNSMSGSIPTFLAKLQSDLSSIEGMVLQEKQRRFDEAEHLRLENEKRVEQERIAHELEVQRLEQERLEVARIEQLNAKRELEQMRKVEDYQRFVELERMKVQLAREELERLAMMQEEKKQRSIEQEIAQLIDFELARVRVILGRQEAAERIAMAREEHRQRLFEREQQRILAIEQERAKREAVRRQGLELKQMRIEEENQRAITMYIERRWVQSNILFGKYEKQAEAAARKEMASQEVQLREMEECIRVTENEEMQALRECLMMHTEDLRTKVNLVSRSHPIRAQELSYFELGQILELETMSRGARSTIRRARNMARENTREILQQSNTSVQFDDIELQYLSDSSEEMVGGNQFDHTEIHKITERAMRHPEPIRCPDCIAINWTENTIHSLGSINSSTPNYSSTIGNKQHHCSGRKQTKVSPALVSHIQNLKNDQGESFRWSQIVDHPNVKLSTTSNNCCSMGTCSSQLSSCPLQDLHLVENDIPESVSNRYRSLHSNQHGNNNTIVNDPNSSLSELEKIYQACNLLEMGSPTFTLS